MTRDDYTHISYVLDRSQSMQRVRFTTISTFNEFVDAQRHIRGKTTLSLTLFNTNVSEVYEVTDLDGVSPLNETRYVPAGMTALFDAAGRTIVSTGSRLSMMPEHERPGHVLFVIQTDGLENSSRQYTAGQLASMRQHQEQVYGWTFLFLGADQDAWANPLGIAPGNTISYSNTDDDVRRVADTVGAYTAATRASAGSAKLSDKPVDYRKQDA